VYSCILHATDLSENHFELCKKAMALAKTFKAPIHFLNVIEQPAFSQLAQGLGFAELGKPDKEDAQTVMQLLGEAIGLPAEFQHIATGTAYQQILDTINELGCDLVILGSHPNHAMPHFLGSTAHAVMQHAACDVMTLRSGD